MVKEKEDKKEDKKEETGLTDLPGIGPGIAAKLEAAGIYDLMGLAVMSPSALSELAGVGEAVARKAIQAARGMMNLGFMDGAEFAKSRENVGYITTGSSNLNTLLGGKGIEACAMTEAYGPFGCGKCVSKDTPVSYFNDTRMHVRTIEETYIKYKAECNEQQFDEGFVVPLSTVKVLAWSDGKLKVTNASHLYKQKIEKIFVIKTKRGRILEVTGNHQLLSFNNGVNWKKAEFLSLGDLIACPREIDLTTEIIYDEDDAYFLGLFAAEGTHNPFSITITDKRIVDWTCEYIEKKFSYRPTVRERIIEGKLPVYIILLRNSTRHIMDGLDNSNSSNKFVPEGIFLSNKNVVSSFLGGYFDGDAEVSNHDISATTKSERLATQLTYLLLRLGISSSLRERTAGVNSDRFKVVRIAGEDRNKLKDIKMKIKKFDYPARTSIYGYPRQIVSFISELYKRSLGGNRGNFRKIIGKSNTSSQIYKNLTNSSMTKVINEKTLQKIEEIFLSQKDEFIKIIKTLESEFSIELLRALYSKLPFAFNSLSENMGIKKKTMRNYYSRKIPTNKSELLRNLILNELKLRVDAICLALELISEVQLFSWDIIESIEIKDYNDFVYDFVVPEGHSFVGGNMPTMMHNSQLAFSLAVNVQMPKEKGGLNGKAVFIDTEGTFSPSRIRQIAEAVGANTEKVLKNILVARAFNADHQILLVDKVSEMIKDGEPIKLVIVDSLTAHFRAEFSGRGQLADRQQKLNKYLHQLTKLAEQHKLSVYVTNQVMANPAMMFGDPTVHVGGHIVGHACLTSESLIQLSDGEIVEIKDMQQQKVLSGDFSDFNFSEANSEQVFLNPDVRRIYNIKTDCQINCSELHRFFTISNFGIVEKEVKDLKIGDFVAQAGKINIEGEEIAVPRFRIKKIGKINKQDSEIIKSKLKEEGTSRKEICGKIGIAPRQFRRVLNNEQPASFEVLDNLQSYFGQVQALQIIPVFSNKHKNLRIPDFITHGFAQIFGYFIGDGNFENRGLRFRDARFEILDFYKNLFKQEFNVVGKISKMKNKNCYTLNINSKEIKELFRLMIPNILKDIAKSKKEIIIGFIKGFFDAEGYVSKKRPHISAVQKNARILRYLQLFLLRFGIRSAIKFEIGTKRHSILMITERDVENFLQIGFTAKDKQKKLIENIKQHKLTYEKEMMPIKRNELRELLESLGLQYSKIIKPRPEEYQWINKKDLENAFNILMKQKIIDRQLKQKIEFIRKLLDSEVRFEKIREINIRDNDKKEGLYDFSVPSKENYIANGFVVHNSKYRIYLRRGKGGSRVARMIDSPNLPDNEAQFYITAQGLGDGI